MYHNITLFNIVLGILLISTQSTQTLKKYREILYRSVIREISGPSLLLRAVVEMNLTMGSLKRSLSSKYSQLRTCQEGKWVLSWPFTTLSCVLSGRHLLFSMPNIHCQVPRVPQFSFGEYLSLCFFFVLFVLFCLVFFVVQLLNCVRLLVTPWILAHQAPLSMRFPGNITR